MDELVIYKLVNKVNEKCYIGQTNNIKRRIRRHKNDSRTSSLLLYKAIRKHGWENFKYKIIEKCDSREELDDLEFHYIKQYRSRQYQNGYNLTDGGYGSNGFIITDEYRKKLSDSLKGRVFTREHCKQISKGKKESYIKENHPNYGKHHSKEIKAKISKSHKGKIISEETKTKIINYLSSKNNVRRLKYKIMSPDGIVTTTKFLKEYCIENNLIYSCMIKTSRGERTHHKNYKIKKV